MVRPVLCCILVSAFAAPASPDSPLTLPGGRERVKASSVLESLASLRPGGKLHWERALVRGALFASAGVDTVRGRVAFTGVRFRDSAIFDGVVFADAVEFEDCEFLGGASFMGTQFLGPAAFRRSHFRGHTSFKGVRTEAGVFELSRFEGPATFMDASFGEVSFDHSRFEDAYFDRARFNGPASFSDADIELEATFKGAAFLDEAVYEGTRFRGETLFRNAGFSGPARFDRARFRRAVRFNRTGFSEQASFRDITFVREASFVEARFEKDAAFSGCRFKSGLDLTGATVGSALYLDADFDGDLILHDSSVSTLDLAGYSARPPESAGDSTAAGGEPRVFLQDSRFDNLRLHWPGLSGRIAAPDSARTGSMAGVYGKLAFHLRESGQERDADEALIEWNDRQRLDLPWTSPRRYLLEFLNVTSRYGSSPVRLILSGLVVVIAFAALYWLRRDRFTADAVARPPSFCDCLLISLCAFVHSGWPAWRSAGGVQALRAVEGVMGWLFWAGLAAVILRLLLRGLA